jgi:glycosyltransferase involved in cell wall biosynthesis
MVLREKTPKVSVCVITYNQEKYIRQCLQSIVDQETDFDFELIVGDDCSTDGTRAIVQEFAERYPEIVKPIYQEKNIGRGCHNYLTVHQTAIGEYVAHVDGDDWCTSNKLASQSFFLDGNPDCVAVVHKLEMCNSAGELLSSFFPGRFSHKKYDLAKLVTTHCEFGHSSLMYRKGAFASLKYAELTEFIDFYIYVHLASQGNIGVVEQVLGRYTYGVGVSSAHNLYELAIHALVYARKVGLPNDIFRSATARQYLLFAKKAFVESNYELFEKLISLSMKERYISAQQAILYLFRKRQKFLRLLLVAYRNLK